MAAMRILHFIYDHPQNPWVGGGAGVRVYEIYRRLAERHDITVVSGKYPKASDYTEGRLAFKFVGSGKNNYMLSTFCYAARAAGYAKASAGRYDAVVEDFAPYNPVFSFLWHQKATIQLHQREGLHHLKKYAFLGIPFFLIEKYYHLFFGTALVESALGVKKFGLKRRYRIIPNGVAPELLRLHAEEGDYILFIGRFHINQKGLDILHDALKLLDCRLVLVGGGKDEDATRILFGDAVRSGRADFAGYAWGKKKEELLGKCLFMVIPSRYEGQPLIVMDSAASGKPVIVSDIPELQYAVEAGFGLSFKTEDAKDLAAKMQVLLRDPSLRRDMGAKARNYARAFSWDSIAEEYEEYLLGTQRP